jgi:WXG100 family type VII secretion target
MSDEIVYRYAGINTVSEAIAAFVRQMNANLADVDAEFRRLLANGWHGVAADAFQTQSQIWHQAATEIEHTLARLGTTVGQAAVNMQEADRRAGSMFA